MKEFLEKFKEIKDTIEKNEKEYSNHNGRLL